MLFYADNGLLPSHMPACLQEVINVLTGMFDMVSLQTNVKKMVGMACHPCYIDIVHLEVTYKRRMMGWGNNLGDGNGNGYTVRSVHQSWWHTARLSTGWRGSPSGQQPYYHQTPGYIWYPFLDMPYPSDAWLRAKRGGK